MVSLEKLEEIKDLRQVWPHEAADFTRWLAESQNLAILGDTIGVDLDEAEVESAVGDFHVDIFTSDSSNGQKIIIENQLESTNHDHLGKLITYASGKSANLVVWLVKHAREEHRSAIEWLNNHTDDQIGFFLCEIKLYKIGDSMPAAKFEVIEKPNDWAKAIKKSDTNNQTMQRRLEYWRAFNEYASTNKKFTHDFNLRKPSGGHWMDFSVGSSKYHIAMCQIRRDGVITIEININNKEIFHKLYQHCAEIEAETGLEFDWQELPDKVISRIRAQKEVDFNDATTQNEQFDWLISSAIKLKQIIHKYLK